MSSTDSKQNSADGDSVAKVANLKDMWQRGEVRTRMAPPVQSKHRASLVMLSGFNVKNRARIWQDVAAEKPVEKTHVTSESVGTESGPAVHNRIEIWKQVTQSNAPSSTPGTVKDPDLETSPVNLKGRIQEYQVAAQQSAPMSHAAPKDIPVSPINLKGRIQEYQMAAQKSTSPVQSPVMAREVATGVHKYDAASPSSTTSVPVDSKPSDWDASYSAESEPMVEPDSNLSPELDAANMTESEPADDIALAHSSPPPTDQQGMTAVCLYNYTAAESDEVSFTMGDVIHSIEQVDEGWWLGTNAEGKTGLFPSNYVQLVT